MHARFIVEPYLESGREEIKNGKFLTKLTVYGGTTQI